LDKVVEFPRGQVKTDGRLLDNEQQQFVDLVGRKMCGRRSGVRLNLGKHGLPQDAVGNFHIARPSRPERRDHALLQITRQLDC
jgi:hypothetical protein